MNDLNVHELWLLWELADGEADCCDGRPDRQAEMETLRDKLHAMILAKGGV